MKNVNLSEHIRIWVKNAVDPNAEVVTVKQLKGSTSSALFQIAVHTDEGKKDLVVRLFDNKEWLQEEPDLALHEAESLRFASEVKVPTPEIIAFDAEGEQCGVPAVLMTMLDGTVELKRADRNGWLDGLAEALGEIHTLNAEDFAWKYFTYQDMSSLGVPSWTTIPDAWREVVAIVKGTRPVVKECFIHRDYHPSNVLFDNGKVSGIVDWVNACKGPAGIDVGHCRVNLAMLYDVETADEFLTAYQHYHGDNFRYDVYWDLVSLMDILFGPPEVYPGWKAFGVTGLTNQLMEERLDRYVVNLLDRV